MKSKKNIIMVLLDGVRVDLLQNALELESLLKRGAFFSEMITYAPYTIASVYAIFTGMYGGRNGINAYYNMSDLKNAVKPLSEYLKESNFYTRADILSAPTLSARGFDKITTHQRNADDLTASHKEIIKDTVKQSGELPFFLYLQYTKLDTTIIDATKQYSDFDEKFFNNYKNNLKLYCTCLKDAEHYAQEIMQEVKDSDLLEDTILVFFSDHGISLGEKKGEHAYGSFTYDYTIRSFCSFINSQDFPQMTIEQMTRTIDIMPTLLDLFNIRPDNGFLQMQGQSLLPLLKNTKLMKLFSRVQKDIVAFCETAGLNGPYPSPHEPNVKCVRTKDWKLIHNRTPDTWELYHLKSDAKEQQNVFGQYPKIEESLKQRLQKVEQESYQS